MTPSPPLEPRAARRMACIAMLLLAMTPAFAAPPLRASDAWIRWLPAHLPAGGYLRIDNPSSQALRLIGARSDAYAKVMLHRTLDRGGSTTMEPVTTVEVPAQGSLRLEPGGLHLMLMEPLRPIHPGDQVGLTLLFEGGTTLAADFTVRPANAEAR
ncbi:MAG: copper chaperone PCu(A)C [Burkholderiales bacterium]|nr:copper chaperone PCu(A)C [Burkholderiales bacterium]